ncbi:MAG: hypothetical protein COB85_08000 [Bacteroidetes bacterium]|nr:MAG: hypothetical protein COB85_08000 [Bacteroidota bacterium]
MGGYAAIKYLFKYPQLFGHATSIDGSIYPSLNHQPNYVDDPAFPYYFSFMGSDTTFFNKTSVYSWVDTFFASTPTPPGKLFILAGSSEPLENYSAQAFVDYLSSVHSYTAKFFVDPNMEHPFDNFLMAYGDSIYNFQNTATCDSVQSPTLPPASIGFKHGIENAILMYPNPALNKITISISELHASQFTLSVSDLTGRVLQNHSFIGREYELNLASLTPGVYLIEVSSEMTKRTYRIIKK